MCSCEFTLLEQNISMVGLGISSFSSKSAMKFRKTFFLFPNNLFCRCWLFQSVSDHWGTPGWPQTHSHHVWKIACISEMLAARSVLHRKTHGLSLFRYLKGMLWAEWFAGLPPALGPSMGLGSLEGHCNLPVGFLLHWHHCNIHTWVLLYSGLVCMLFTL